MAMMRCRWALALVLALALSRCAFLGFQAHPRPRWPRCDPSDGALARRAMSDDDLQVLQSRIEELRQRPVLPLLFIDAMLPGQRLVFDSSAQELVELEGEVGVLGVAPGASAIPRFGSAAQLARREGRWELRAERAFKIVGVPEQGEDGIAHAKVEFLHSDATEEEMQLAESLPGLVEEWMATLREYGAERYTGQLDDILKDLGTMPSVQEAQRLAIWVAALVNPLPALGVALEIRPAVLAAATVKEQLEIAEQGMRGSIDHISGRRRLF
ncbi:unnamed protein product [Effrenium voratum]|nr:unnamed protein product [Effrenium voratum]